PEEPRSLGNPLSRIGPRGRAVLGDDDVERRVRERHVLPRRLDELELDPRLAHQPPRGLELCRGRVDADRTRSALREPRREVGGSTPELDDVLTGDLAEDVQLGLVPSPLAPADLAARPRAGGRSVRVLRVDPGPERDVALEIRRAHRRTR